MEAFNNSIGLASFALVIPDGLNQVGRASVVEEEDPLPNAPERGRSEFIGSGGALWTGAAFGNNKRPVGHVRWLGIGISLGADIGAPTPLDGVVRVIGSGRFPATAPVQEFLQQPDYVV